MKTDIAQRIPTQKTVIILEDGEEMELTRQQLASVAHLVYRFAPGMYHLKDGVTWSDIDAAKTPKAHT